MINVDKNAAYPRAIADLKAIGVLPQAVELRQVKYLNNIVEQDHRFMKRRVKPGLGFFSFETCAGYLAHPFAKWMGLLLISSILLELWLNK